MSMNLYSKRHTKRHWSGVWVLSALLACGGDRAVPQNDSADSMPAPGSGNPSASDNATPSDTTPYVYVTEYGIGDLRAGMTLEEARRVVPALQLIAGADSTACTYLEWPTAPAGVLVMFDQGRVARVDVDSAGVRTAAGIQVGDAAARVDSAYGDRLTKGPHKYTDGEYFTVTPIRAADSLYRVIFEVEAGRVLRYRVGVLPQVAFVEGCS